MSRPYRRVRPTLAVRNRFKETPLGAMPLGLCFLVAVGLAASFLGGDARRFNGTAWASPFQLLSQHGWGCMFAAYAVVLLLACARGLSAIRLAMVLGAVPYGFLATTFTWSALASPVAATTGIVVYAGVAVAHPVLGELYRK